MRTSGAVQVRDLAKEFASTGHDVTVMVPSVTQRARWAVDMVGGGQGLSLAPWPTKDLGYIRRTLAEVLLPFKMWRGLRSSPLASVQWQAAIWYSPSIFLGIL